MNQTKLIHRLLKRGWTSMRVLNNIAFRYSARMHELRQEGVEIERERRTNGMWYYRVKPVSVSDDQVNDYARQFASDCAFDDLDGGGNLRGMV